MNSSSFTGPKEFSIETFLAALPSCFISSSILLDFEPACTVTKPPYLWIKFAASLKSTCTWNIPFLKYWSSDNLVSALSRPFCIIFVRVIPRGFKTFSFRNSADSLVPLYSSGKSPIIWTEAFPYSVRNSTPEMTEISMDLANSFIISTLSTVWWSVTAIHFTCFRSASSNISWQDPLPSEAFVWIWRSHLFHNEPALCIIFYNFIRIYNLYTKFIKKLDICKQYSKNIVNEHVNILRRCQTHDF